MKIIQLTLKRFLMSHRAIDGFGLYLCFLDMLLKRDRVRTITINGTEVSVRTQKADLKVALSSLIEKEYDHIHVVDPAFIVDAGANIGTSAVFFAKKYPNAQIVAVEPEAGNFDLLLKNTADYQNVDAVKAAVWGVSDRRSIQNRNTGHWGYTVSDSQDVTVPVGQEIDCITMRSLMDSYGAKTIDLLKMDIEGGEKHVLENSSDWIDSVRVMTVELHDRICMGCDRAFYLATERFKRFEKHGEKVTAYR